MTNFIVPVDFSVDSLKGLDWAILFSQKRPVNIQLVYVLSNSTNFQPSVVDQEHKYAQVEFEKLLKEYQPRLGKSSKIRFIIKKGKVYREVVNQVESYKNAVVSASTHGASGFEELFIGSNALKIIAATQQPVFTLRKSVPGQINKIVVPIKLHRATRQKAPIVAEIAELFGAELHVVAISTSKNKRDMVRLESYAKQVEGYFTARNLKSVTKSLVGESLPVLTCNYAEAVDADLISIVSSAVDRWNVLLGSYAQQMINKSSIPLLNITPQEKHISSGFRTFGR
ncbi:MAG: universal stress protein [Bacteroidetes bacterium]|nr:universal stress protein [Bacteroidota bacterium]